MANTWTALTQGITFAAGKSMLGLLNGGSRILRLRRIGILNNQTAAVTGVACLMDIRRYTSAGWTTPTTITPVAHDTGNSALDTITAGSAGTPTGTGPDTFRRVFWSSDEPSISTGTSDEWECIVPLNIIWDAGYGDSNVQPLTCRASQAYHVYNTVGAAGIADIWCEFTDEAS